MRKTIVLFLIFTGIILTIFYILNKLVSNNKPVTEKQIYNNSVAQSKKKKIAKLTHKDPANSSISVPIMPDDSILIMHLTGKFDYTKDPYFVKVASEHCYRPMYLQKEAYDKFKEMHAAAKKEGILITILSGTRNFYDQKSIWENKWNNNIKTMDSISAAKKILLYSSMPTTSRHHWGTDIDINSLTNSYFETGQGLEVYNWLKKNAATYGFCDVYNDKSLSNRSGYQMEKWHWSYMPIASEYLKKYNKLVTYSMINGFQASELASKLRAIEEYVNGIEKKCNKC